MNRRKPYLLLRGDLEVMLVILCNNPQCCEDIGPTFGFRNQELAKLLYLSEIRFAPVVEPSCSLVHAMLL